MARILEKFKGRESCLQKCPGLTYSTVKFWPRSKVLKLEKLLTNPSIAQRFNIALNWGRMVQFGLVDIHT